MNAVVYIVMASICFVTVKAIKRIPINLFYKGNSNKKHYSEVLPVTDDAEDERTLSATDDITNAVDSDKSTNVDLKFTDFILEVAKVLKTYENDDLEQAFAIIDYEIWENMYKGCKSHELADIRRSVSDKLALLKDDPGDTLRQHLDTIIDTIRAEDYGEVGDMVNFVNSLYVGEHEKFIEVLLALVHRRISTDIDLAVILKYAIKYLIFDNYCDLDNTVRHELIKMIKHYWNQIASQIVNDKTGPGLNTLVTPFVYEKRNDQIHKKRRFDTVNEGRPLNKHDSEYSDGNIGEKRMRANSAEISHQRRKHISCSERKCQTNDVRSVELENTNDASSKNDPVLTNNTAVDVENEIIKTVTRNAFRGSLYRAHQNPVPEESTSDALGSKTPVRIFGNSNKTIETLIKIGTLAKEINDMIASDGKVLRTGPNARSWNTIMGPQFVNMLGDYGDVPTPPTPDIIKAAEGDRKKDILISMQAKYQE